MPTTSPAAFLGFVAEQVELLVAMLESGGVDQSELPLLVAKFRKEHHASADHILRRLTAYHVLRPTAHADTELELAAPLAELLRWLLNRQRLAGAAVLQGHLAQLQTLQAELRNHIESGDHSNAVLALNEAVERTATGRLEKRVGSTMSSIGRETTAQWLRARRSTETQGSANRLITPDIASRQNRKLDDS